MMESEEQWSRRDFTQIKPRRPEGAESCTEDHWEDSGTFSFLWGGGSGVSGVSGVGEGGGGGCGGEDGINGERDGEMEEEFEFSSVMTSSSVVVERSLSPPDRISPADELFFKGQLLPLHLPPRIQMVKKLVLERQHGQREYRECSAQEQELQPRYEAPVAATTTTAASEGVRNSTHRKVESMGAMNALSQARFARLFQPKYSKFCNFASSSEVVAPAPAPRLVGSSSSSSSWWDPRDSSHHGHHEYSSAGSFTSTDRDSSGDSSSSRDSNGSSQDCFDSGTKEGPFLTTTDNSKGFFHNREVFSTHSAHPDQRSGNGISTWLRPPFKWKVLFGAKKPSTSKPLSSPYDIEVHPRAQSMEAAGLSELAFSPSPGGVSADRYYSDCSGELTYSGDLLLSSRTFVHGTGDVMDQKYPSRGMERARGYLQKYIQKALKNPSRSKEIHHHHHHSSSHVDDGFPATSSPSSSSSSTSAASSTTRGSPAITTSKMFPPFSQSFRFSPKDIPLRMKRPPPASPSPSPLPGPRRVSTSSATSELHCDIKGAIAHCKESQQQVSPQRQQDDDPSSCVLNRPKVSTSD